MDDRRADGAGCGDRGAGPHRPDVRRLAALSARPADYATGLLDVRKAAADAVRAPEDVTAALFVTVRDDEGAEHGRRALDAHARADYGLPLEELEQIQAVVTRSGAQVREGLARYVAAGARHLVCRPAAVGLRTLGDRVERVADLIPLLQAP